MTTGSADERGCRPPTSKWGRALVEGRPCLASRLPVSAPRGALPLSAPARVCRSFVGRQRLLVLAECRGQPFKDDAEFVVVGCLRDLRGCFAREPVIQLDKEAAQLRSDLLVLGAIHPGEPVRANGHNCRVPRVLLTRPFAPRTVPVRLCAACRRQCHAACRPASTFTDMAMSGRRSESEESR